MPTGRMGAGLGLAVLSAVTFGTSGSFATGLLATGWSPGAAVLARVAVAAVVLTGPALVQLRGSWRALRAQRWSVLLYGLVAIGLAQLCYFNAVSHVSVAVGLLLEYSGVVLVVAWTWARTRQAPGRATLGGAVLAVVGLVFVLDLAGRQRVDGVGILWGLGAAVGLATYFVLSAEVDAEAGPPLPAVVAAWSGMVVATATLGVFSAIGAMPLAASTGSVDLGGARLSWVVPVLGLAVVAAAVAYSTGIGAARLLGARLASFVGLIEVLAAALFAWLLLGQRPSAVQGAGGLIVLAGIALVRLGERETPAGFPAGADRSESRPDPSSDPR